MLQGDTGVAVLKRDEIPQIPDRVDFWLLAWARWMRTKPADEMELGYPSRVKPWIGGGESQRGDDWSQTEEQNILQYNCSTMNALIESLPPAQGCAVQSVYAGDEWRFPRKNRLELLETAAQSLLLGMNKWGIL